MSWTHAAPAQEIHCGAGAVDGVGELLRRAGARDSLLVTSPRALDSDGGRRLQRALGHGLVSSFEEVEPHVPAPVVQAAFLQARRDGVDSIVSFGGGSCTEVAKAVCFFSEQEAGTPGIGVGDRPALPHVAVPTTYVGAALTTSFWMTEPGSGQTRAGESGTLVPAGVLYDPEVVSATPPDLRVQTGVTALAQAVGAALEPPTPEAEALGLAGATRLHRWLAPLGADAEHEEAGAQVLEGAVLSGRALVGGMNPLSLGLARLLGARTATPHRTLIGPLLPHVVRRRVEGAPEAAEGLTEALGVDDLPQALGDLVAGLGLPTALAACGVTGDDLDATARLAQTDPTFRRMGEEELRGLLDDAA